MRLQGVRASIVAFSEVHVQLIDASDECLATMVGLQSERCSCVIEERTSSFPNDWSDVLGSGSATGAVLLADRRRCSETSNHTAIFDASCTPKRTATATAVPYPRSYTAASLESDS